MTHEPRHKLGDSIFYMSENRIVESKIYGIKTDFGKYNFLYMVFIPSNGINNVTEVWMYDIKIFKTKEDLLESLK